MNITPDHLDRYDYKMENYIAAKFRIIRNQTEQDSFIFWEDDPIIAEQLKNLKIEAKIYPFSANHSTDAVAYLEGGELVINTDSQHIEMNREELALQGLHNMFNSMAAGLSASILDIKKDVIRQALEDFEAVEHRLEYVETIDGVDAEGQDVLGVLLYATGGGGKDGHIYMAQLANVFHHLVGGQFLGFVLGAIAAHNAGHFKVGGCF
jgi:UDP-N-acetylmuramoylalanine-D-glutamate ligase